MATRILIVDDDSDFLRNLSAALSGAGFDVLTALDITAAEKVLGHPDHGIDLLIVDLVLPGAFSGFDIISAVTRTKPPFKVIATSAVYRSSVLEYVSDQVGVDSYVEKGKPGEPFDPAPWIETVRKLLSDDVLADTPAE